jgi:hypothetical protein
MTQAQNTRDAALRRLSNANRWIVATAAVATGVLTDVVAQAFPGHKIKKSAPSGAAAGRHPASAGHRRRHHRASLTPAPVAPAPVTPAPVTPAPVAPTPQVYAPPPQVYAPPPVPAPAPVVSGGS